MRDPKAHTIMLALLDPVKPMPEARLIERLRVNAELDEEQAKSIINRALFRNEIRWVAFTGFCSGGRP